MKYHSQSHTSIVLALKNELLNSLLTFSSGKVLQCRQTQIQFGVPVQSLYSKDNNVLAELQMAARLWRHLCVYGVFRVLLILKG